MSIVTVTLSNKGFQLYCNNGEEGELLSLAVNLDNKITEIKLVNPTASFELLLVMSSLNSQAEIAALTTKLEKSTLQKNPQDVEKFAETLNTMAGYLENLARKMEKLYTGVSCLVRELNISLGLPLTLGHRPCLILIT